METVFGKRYEETIPSRGPLVSFIVLSYNNAQFIAYTLASVKAQTYPNLEIIIGDDGSSDGSPSKILEFVRACDRPCVAVLHRRNGGIAANYNSCLALARGKYIVHIGSDDICRSDRVSIQLSVLSSSKASMCISGQRIISGTGKYLTSRLPSPEQITREFTLRHGTPRVTSPTMFYDRELIDKFGKLPAVLENEDEALALRALWTGGIVMTEECLVDYRVHGMSVTGQQRQVAPARYLSWLFRNIPARIANKEHWLQVVAATGSPATDERRVREIIADLRRELSTLEVCGAPTGSGLSVLRRLATHSVTSRSILRDYLVHVVRVIGGGLRRSVQSRVGGSRTWPG